MKITLNKVSDGKWNVLKNGEVIGECVPSHKYHGSYKVTFSNGDNTEIYTFSLRNVIEMVTKRLNERELYK